MSTQTVTLSPSLRQLIERDHKAPIVRGMIRRDHKIALTEAEVNEMTKEQLLERLNPPAPPAPATSAPAAPATKAPVGNDQIDWDAPEIIPEYYKASWVLYEPYHRKERQEGRREVATDDLDDFDDEAMRDAITSIINGGDIEVTDNKEPEYVFNVSDESGAWVDRLQVETFTPRINLAAQIAGATDASILKFLFLENWNLLGNKMRENAIRLSLEQPNYVLDIRPRIAEVRANARKLLEENQVELPPIPPGSVSGAPQIVIVESNVTAPTNEQTSEVAF